MSALETFHYHVADDAAVSDEPRSPGSFRESAPGIDPPPITFTSDEAAARFYLDELLQRDQRPSLRSVVEPERPELVPALVVESEQDLAALGTRQVRLAQTHHTIPVFGAGAVVELTARRELVSVTAQLDEVTGVDPVESLGRADAVRMVERYTGASIPADAAVGGRLTFYKDERTSDWHLAWHLRGLPAAPPSSGAEAPAGAVRGHGLGRRPIPPRYDYLVDAHGGEILYHYSAIPTAGPIPTRCAGIDEDGRQQSFFGQLVNTGGTRCLLADPRRSVRTYDLEFADIDDNPPLPDHPVEASTSDFGTTARAAVSAHVNAARVQDFYQVVLQRDGIDDRGMAFISQVNATAASMEPPPTLLNAFWWDGKMWYGQIRRDGRLVSLSRHLDVIAHELTHGVIETTSNLVYATQSGALNESFADVAGVVINNWYNAPDRHDVDTWDWEIGRGLDNGNPLRDFANPPRFGLPDHMNKFRALPPGQLPHNGNDNGFVHFNSSIPNKAVHNLLTITKNGHRVLGVEDVAVLTYLGMTRLTSRATFAEALQAVLDVAQTYFGGDPSKKEKLDAIREAYRLVGII